MTDSELRYSRQIRLGAVGASGQKRLHESRVLIIGAGGLGNPAGLYLASTGIGTVVINDFDTVDESNLPRQILYTEADLGQPKACVMAAKLRTVNPAVNVISLEQRLDRAKLHQQVKLADVVLDCTDNFASRWLLNEVCVESNTPLISGAAIRWEGQVTVFRADRSPSPCYLCLYEEGDENLNDCAGQGIVAPVAGAVGCMMATETIKVLLGIESDLTGRLWIYDGQSAQTRLIKIAPRKNCPVCG